MTPDQRVKTALRDWQSIFKSSPLPKMLVFPAVDMTNVFLVLDEDEHNDFSEELSYCSKSWICLQIAQHSISRFLDV
jgi:hypothetical protein